jgi:hypothetical protein
MSRAALGRGILSVSSFRLSGNCRSATAGPNIFEVAFHIVPGPTQKLQGWACVGCEICRLCLRLSRNCRKSVPGRSKIFMALLVIVPVPRVSCAGLACAPRILMAKLAFEKQLINYPGRSQNISKRRCS